MGSVTTESVDIDKKLNDTSNAIDLLDEQFPKILYDSELNIWIKPIKTNELNTEETYERPTTNTLQSLGNQLDPQTIYYLANILQYDKKITKIRLGNSAISDIGTQYLANVLQHNTTLVTFDIRYNKIGPAGAQYLANALLYNTTLTVLHLGYNEISDEGTQYLANALHQNTTLAALHLWGNKISNAGARDLANALKYNRTLIKLDLRYNQIGRARARYLAHALQYNTVGLALSSFISYISYHLIQTLTMLSLEQNSIDFQAR
ncbi:unnamed protein product [Rotaria sordida]|uniref:RNI-like protein n=1 Tax=Rotaria sordida TaxID=392033 RepID=A0A816AWR4_9BILA|nr:unnamed protein product [Rotaria sordida]